VCRNWKSIFSCSEAQIKRIFTALTKTKKDKGVAAASAVLRAMAEDETGASGDGPVFSATTTTTVPAVTKPKRGRPKKNAVLAPVISEDIVSSLGLDDAIVVQLEDQHDSEAALAMPEYEGV
jgi:hypothetical protein